MLMPYDSIHEFEMHRDHLARVYRDGQYDQAQIKKFAGKLLRRLGERMANWGMRLQAEATRPEPQLNNNPLY